MEFERPGVRAGRVSHVARGGRTDLYTDVRADRCRSAEHRGSGNRTEAPTLSRDRGGGLLLERPSCATAPLRDPVVPARAGAWCLMRAAIAITAAKQAARAVGF